MEERESMLLNSDFYNAKGLLDWDYLEAKKSQFYN